MTPARLSLRALNRATLERQLLLRRAPLAAGAAVRAHLMRNTVHLGDRRGFPPLRPCTRP